MRAVRLHGIGDLRLDTIAETEPAPGEIAVRVEAAGICGTDRHIFKGEFPSNPVLALGHEFSGIVTARGDGVTGITIGDRVTCDPNIFCGTCSACRVGRVNLCRNLQAVGVHRNGGFADYATFPAKQAFTLPASLHPHHGAFCEPLACCIHGIDIGKPIPGERAIVIGGGVIGMLVLQLLRNAGAEVMLVTRHKDKRDLAIDLGAAHVAASLKGALDIWPEGGDLVMECAGVAETVANAQHLTRSGGRIVILGVLAAGETVEVEPFDLLFREVQMLFAFINPFTQGRAARMIAEGRVQVAKLISRVIPMTEAVEAITNPPRGGEIKVLVIPG